MVAKGKVVLELEVILGTYDGLLVGLIYDLLDNKGKLHSKFLEKGHIGSIRSLAAASSGLVATGGSDEIIKLYDMRRHTEVGTLIQHEGTVNCLHFHKDCHLISASDDGSICLWSTLDWSCVSHLKGHCGPVYSVAIHPSGKLALSVGKDKTIRTWNLSTGECAYIKRASQVIELIQWTPIGDGYLTASNNSITLFSVQSGAILQQIVVTHYIYSVAYITDEIIAVGSESHDIFHYSVLSGELVHTLKGHASRVKSLSFVSGANLLFSGSSDGTVCVWNISSDNVVDSVCVSQYTVPGEVRLTSLTLVYPEELEEQKPKKVKKRERHSVDNNHEGEVKLIEEETIKKKKPSIMFKEAQEEMSSLTNRNEKDKKKTTNNGTKTAVGGVVTVEYETNEGQAHGVAVSISSKKRKQCRV